MDIVYYEKNSTNFPIYHGGNDVHKNNYISTNVGILYLLFC